MAEPIAAIATGVQRAAIGVIRLSGEGCIQAVARVFRPDSGRAFGAGTPGRLTLGDLTDADGRRLDRALAVFFRPPRSYTGEEAAELHCHGSPAGLALALEALFAQGVRQAAAGEFTRRAFLNGKLDLLEAEAVADLVDARTPAAVRQAAGQLSGALSRQVEEVYDGLVELMAHFHAELDYPDEDLAPFTDQTVREALETARGKLEALLATYQRGRCVKEGVPTAIVGRPNVGKSTLLNALVGYDRSIVADLPGTTRDTVEEGCVLGGVFLRLIDTAGLRDAADPVERLGVERARRAMEGAELILAVVDGSAELTGEDLALLRETADTGKPWVLVASKMDLARDSRGADLVGAGNAAPAVELSARTGEGLDRLGAAVASLFPQGVADSPGEVLTNLRQAQAARRALEAVERARGAQAAGVPPDVLLTDVEEALSALGELTGTTVREDVADRIFSRFCVGK